MEVWIFSEAYDNIQKLKTKNCEMKYHSTPTLIIVKSVLRKNLTKERCFAREPIKITTPSRTRSYLSSSVACNINKLSRTISKDQVFETIKT
jgi:hypothetical protein